GEAEDANGKLGQAVRDLGVQQGQTQRALDDLGAQQRETEQALYDNLIALADREWWANNIAKAEETLKRCPGRLCGWEWQYQQRRLQQEVLTLGGKGNQLRGMAYSPDGKLLATQGGTQGSDWDLKLWDADTGRELRTLAHGFRGVKFNILAFSPDGLRL